MVVLVGDDGIAHEFGTIGHTLFPVVRHHGLALVALVAGQGDGHTVKGLSSRFGLVHDPGLVTFFESLALGTAAFVEVNLLRHALKGK